jgi:signal peptidase I
MHHHLPGSRIALMSPVLRPASVAAVSVTALVLLTAAGLLAMGYRVSPVLSASMTPTYRAGDAIVTKPVPARSLRPGMIPVIIPPGEAVPYAHRITTVSGSPSALVVTTKGDANPLADPWHARIDARRVPVVVAAVPTLGRVLVWIHGRALRAVLLALLGLLVTGVGTRMVTSNLRSPSPRATTS